MIEELEKRIKKLEDEVDMLVKTVDRSSEVELQAARSAYAMAQALKILQDRVEEISIMSIKDGTISVH